MTTGDVRRRTFHRLLVNSLVSGVTTTFLWFALVFWVYLETRSVVATSALGGGYAALAAVLGVGFGTFVDRHRKHRVMLVSTVASGLAFVAAAAVYAAVPAEDLLRLRSPWFWILITLTLAGAVIGQLRGIALSTCVTLLVAEPDRAKANGLVGTVTGVTFALTSVFSGLAVGQLGMGWAYVIATVLMGGAVLQLTTIEIVEPEPEKRADGESRVDVRGALGAVRIVPGLMMLILFAALNNLLGGVFLSLMDAYGLSMVSVETWGILWGFLSLGFVAGGLIVARRGLGPDPLRLIVIGNLVNWTICAGFAMRSSIILLSVGMFLWLVSIPIVEAAEQTVMQQTVPFQTQGRVFGFAQMIENAASPITSFLVGPIAEVLVIPVMTDGRGADWIGDWFGTGQARGIALMFVMAGLVGVAATVVVRLSRSYRLLSDHVAASAPA